MGEKKSILNWGDLQITVSVPKGKRVIIISTERLAEVLRKEQWNGNLPESVNVKELVQVIARQI